MNGGLDQHEEVECGVDEELMFEFDQDFSRGSVSSSYDANSRPGNPVASLLQSDDDEEEDKEEFAPTAFSSRPVALVSPPPSTSSSNGLFFDGSTSERHPEPLDFNGRRKRKARDDGGAFGSGRVRPQVKRAKSFCFGDARPPRTPSPSVYGPGSSLSQDAALQEFNRTRIRSESINIPTETHSRPRRPASSNGASSSNGCAGSGSSSSSWNASSSFEYFCRRSLDVSSPLRLRFRDLMVGSVGRVDTYKCD